MAVIDALFMSAKTNNWEEVIIPEKI
jgi:hypothetical protein